MFADAGVDAMRGGPFEALVEVDCSWVVVGLGSALRLTMMEE